MEKLTFTNVILFVCVYSHADAQVVLNPDFSFDRIRPDRHRPIDPIRPIEPIWPIDPIDPIIPIDPIRPPKPIPPRVYPSKLDVLFIMDSTGSMSPYIENVRHNIRRFVDEITASSVSDVHMGLILYRDHPPQDHSFVTKKYDFTSSVLRMKSWLDIASASGGGDKPEAIADALYDATKVSWRPGAVKIGILISDAPPHGLSPTEDRSFKQGSPKGHDPIELTHELMKLGVTMYTVGCEPSILPYKDFFMALAYVTGGQYIPLSYPQRLIEAIIGGAQEELSLQSFSDDVKLEIQRTQAAGKSIDEATIAQTVFKRLKGAGAQSTQLLRNSQPLEEASSAAKSIAGAKNMAEVRGIFASGTGSTPVSSSSSSFASKFKSAMGSASSGSLLGRLSGSLALSPKLELGLGILASESAPSSDMAGAGSGMAAASPVSGSSETFVAAKLPISLDQVTRLVRKQTAALGV